MRKVVYLFVITILVSGCSTATGKKMNKINLGMTKQEVIKTIGSPSSTKANEGVEVLVYMLYPCTGLLDICNQEPYWVTLRNSKVVQYGRAGDFGSAMPADRREYNIKTE